MSAAAAIPGRGRPLRAMALLLGSWVAVRAMAWPAADPLDQMPQLISEPAAQASSAPPYPQRVQLAPPAQAEPRPWLENQPRTIPEAPVRRPVQISMVPTDLADMVSAGSVPVRLVVGHNVILMAGLSTMELDPALVPYVQGAGPRMARRDASPAPAFAPAAAERFAAETGGTHRWSMDAWALWREDENSPLLSGRPTYGRSQAGAVVRFALAPGSRHAPQAHLRATTALAGAREHEAALGISARPLPFLPVRIAAEGRLRESAAGTEARAAAFAVSEFPPLSLPAGATGEAYVQGGYVTGRFATPFVDGQARITRDIASGDHLRLSAGGGAWGGAQEGSGRLDIGPSASLNVSSRGVNARVSADYRFRVAGEAVPANGPALTISAGF